MSPRRRQKLRNAAQGVLLLGGMVAALAALAWMVLGRTGLFWMIGFGVLLLLVRPRIPAEWTLSMYGARPLPEYAAPELHHYVRVLALRAGLPGPPAIYYVASPITNAFSVGSGADAALAVSDGLLRRLTGRQVVGVLAHEISHIRAGDTAIMGLSDGIGRLVQGFSYVGMLMVLLTAPMTLSGDLRPLLFAAVLIVQPTLVTLLQLALSRSREYDADLEAVALTGDAEGLAGALMVLETVEGQIWERIMRPRGRVPDPLLLRTHPPTAERVRRLLELVPGGVDGRLGQDRPVTPTGYPGVTGRPKWRSPGIRW